MTGILATLLWTTVGSATASSGPPELIGYKPISLGYAFLTSLAPLNSITMDPHGLETTWVVEYSQEGSGSWTVECSGAFSQREVEEREGSEFTAPSEGSVTKPCAEITGLPYETAYVFRIRAKNADGEISATEVEATTSRKPLQVAADTGDVTGASALLRGNFSPQAAATAWKLEYSTSQTGGWQVAPGGGGTISEAEAAEAPKGYPEGILQRAALLTGLATNTTYYVRLTAENAHGVVTSTPKSFHTNGNPEAVTFGAHSLDGETTRVIGDVDANGRATNELQSVTAGGKPTGGMFNLCIESECTGATGTGTLKAGSALVEDVNATQGAFIENAAITGPGIPAGTTVSCVTSGCLPENLPDHGKHTIRLSAPATASVSGSRLEAGISVVPLGGSELPERPQTAVREHVYHALSALPGVEGVATYIGGSADEVIVEFAGKPVQGKNIAQMSADASGLTPAGTVAVNTIENGAPLELHDHFEYVPLAKYEAGGFAEAADAPQVQGSGVVAQDLNGLTAGEAYEFRLVSTSNGPGNPVSDGNPAELTVPAPGASTTSPCPNEARRGGPSAALPDCRAYEQVTPSEKAGAQDIYKYGAKTEAAFVGEDGQHFMLHVPGVAWGQNPDVRTADYFFTRGGNGWEMTSVRPEGEASATSFQPFLFNSNLTSVGLEGEWTTSFVSESAKIEMLTGPPGGPYGTVAAIPRELVEREQTWVAMSASGGKAVLESGDHKLLPGGKATGTVSGNDLYEYSAGELRQVNGGAGRCGARIVRGYEGYEGQQQGEIASPHAMSEDGSRIFFEATPGNVCSAPTQLYMRLDGGGTEARTVDLGEYIFRAATPDGQKVLVEAPGSKHELLLDEVDSGTLTPLLATKEAIFGNRSGDETPVVSESLDAIYFFSAERLTANAPNLEGGAGSLLYRFDIESRTLQFVAISDENGSANLTGHSVSPDGRYFYWLAPEVEGVLGGAVGGAGAYRFDSVEDVVQCLSCASPFDPHPRFETAFAERGTAKPADGAPQLRDASVNGDYVFFETPAALVPQDVDGEVAPEGVRSEHSSTELSVSSDVYEWRKNGVDGCAHVQGCIALISSGTGGYMNAFLGTSASGEDVFFATHSSLTGSDNDSGGDIYDARVGGGFAAPAAAPVECEAGACQRPAPAPIDSTPGSSTFVGPGNPAAAAPRQGKARLHGNRRRPGHARSKRGGRRHRRRHRRPRASQRRRRARAQASAGARVAGRQGQTRRKGAQR